MCIGVLDNFILYYNNVIIIIFSFIIIIIINITRKFDLFLSMHTPDQSTLYNDERCKSGKSMLEKVSYH